MQYEFVKSVREGRMGIRTSYNQEFVNQLKMFVPSAKWSGETWFFDSIAKDQVRELAKKYWPEPDIYQTVRISWNLDREEPQIDGIRLANVSRDYWNWRRDCPIQFNVIENTLESGGSRNNPGLYGTLVIETKIRPGAKITPEPEKVAVIESGAKPNPLEKFSDEELLAELKRRGH